MAGRGAYVMLAWMFSGIKVWDKFAAQFLDLILEQELAFFQAPHLDLVNKGLLRQGCNTVIEISVLYDQLFQFLPQALFVFQQHHRISVSVEYASFKHIPFHGFSTGAFNFNLCP
jgi:hypothetical protein